MAGPFVGREAELTAIGGVAHAVFNGRTAALVVVGDPGQGKSRLLSEAHARLRLPRQFMLVGYEPEQDVPLGAASRLLAMIVGLHGEGALDRILAEADRDLASAARGLGSLRIFEAAHRAIDRSGPSLLTIDDAQWLDEQTGALCHYLVRAALTSRIPLGVVAAGRPGRRTVWLADALQQLLGGERSHTLELGPLPMEAGTALARDLAPQLDASQALDVWHRAAGSPFWIEALSNIQSGSDKTIEVVLGRARGLSATAGELLDILTVLGRPAARRELSGLVGGRLAQVEAASGELVGRGLAIETGGMLRLAHDLIRDAAATALPAPNRLRLHRLLAHRLEADAGEDLAALLEVLAHRAAAGQGVVELATRVVRSPRRRWLGLSGLRRLIEVVDEADLADPAVQSLRAGVARLATDLDEHEIALEQWRAVREAEPTSTLRRAATLAQAREAFLLRRATEARDLMDQLRSAGGLTLAEQVAANALEAQILLWLERRHADARAVAMRGVNRARAAASTAGGTEVLGPELRSAYLDALHSAWEVAMQADDRQALGTLAEELNTVSLGFDEHEQLFAIVRGGIALRTGQGQLANARHQFQRAWDVARQRIHLAVAIDAGFWLALTNLELGRIAEAEAIISEVNGLVHKVGDIGQIRGISRTVRFEIGLAAGRWQEAAQGMRLAAEGEPDPHHRLAYHQVLAQWLARIDEPGLAETAVAELQRSQTCAQLALCRRCEMELELVAAEVLVRTGHASEAIGSARRWDAGRPDPDPVGLLHRRHVAALQHLVADAQLGIAELEECLANALGMERALDALLIKLDLAGALRPRDAERAVQLLREVAAEASQIGALTYQRLAERALRALGRRTWRRSLATTHHLGLTRREIEVARLVVAGATNPEIASALFLSRKTIERHVSHVLAKTGARNRTDLTRRLGQSLTETSA